MKVRLFTLAAVAATTLLSQGVAQSDSLERALADLNSGLVAPAGNAGVTWGGDFRLRNNWFDLDDSNDALDFTNNRDFDTRVRLTASFNVTEDSSAFVGFTGAEEWGSTDANAFVDEELSANGSHGNIERAYVTVNNLMGDGGSMKAGRDYYTVGEGRIMGSSEWANHAQTYSGVWYAHDAGGMNFNFAMINGEENGAGGADEGDDMVYVASIDYALEAGPLGTINLSPYAMRAEDDNSMNWKGAFLSGEIMGFGYDAEYSKSADHDNTLEGSAWYVSTSIELDFLASIPGISNGGLDLTFSNADDEFSTSGNELTHGVGGFADATGTGTWADGKSSTSLGLNFSPAEGWNGRVALHETEGNFGDGSDAADDFGYSETNISVGHDFNGNVSGWFGYAMVDIDDTEDDVDVFWTTLSLDF